MSRSESRRKTRAIPIRWAPDELAVVQEKAAVAGATFADFVRSAALGKRIVGRSREQLINELRRLGGLQKHLAAESGGRASPFAQEYAELLQEIVVAIRRVATEAE